MSIAHNLIANESIEFSSKKHWIAPLRDSIRPVLLLLLAYLINWFKGDSTSGITGAFNNLLDLIRVGLIVVAVAWIIYNIIVWRTAEFAVTNLRVIREEGLVSRRSSATLLRAVTDVKSGVGLLGKSLKYGDLSIITQSGEAGADRFRTITTPEEFRNAIMTHKMGEEQALAGGPAAAPAGPGAAPAAAGAMSADTAMALASLADLRDRGVLTDAEYQSKKAEILGGK